MGGRAQAEGHLEIARVFGGNLVRARRAAGLSQEALAFESALHRTEIGMLERGIRIPRIDTALKLARTVGVTLDELVEGLEWRATVRTGGWIAAGDKGARI